MKTAENQNGKFRTLKGLASEVNLSREVVKDIAEKAGAVYRYGERVIRVDAEKFYSYMDRMSN